MKIYTKTGDDGTTGLFGGGRLPKNHIRIEAYGTVDELNSFIGLLTDTIHDADDVMFFRKIQSKLFTIGSHLATENSKMTDKLPAISEDDIKALENKMDEADEILQPMKHFILPGGNISISYCHVARCVCRRAERNIIALSQHAEINPVIQKYLNRLSDFLFVYARKLHVKLNVEEIPWIP
jgi:cob(I)alamin adenosyltransferase